MGTCNSNGKSGGLGKYVVKAGKGFEYTTESGRKMRFHINNAGVVFRNDEPITSGSMSKRENIDKVYKIQKDKGGNDFRELSKKDVNKEIKKIRKEREGFLKGLDAAGAFKEQAKANIRAARLKKK
jgi:hypothetical protein